MTTSPPSDVPRSSLYYQYSGIAPPGSVVLALGLGIIAAVVAALIYSAAIVYIPFVYIKILLTLGLGIALGAVPATLLRWGRVRNRFLTLVVVLIVTTVGYYAVWISWLWLLFNKSHFYLRPLALFEKPYYVWRLILRLNDHGTWGLGEHPTSNVQGLALWGVWLGEAGIILYTAIKTAAKLASAEPFCEACNRWCGKAKRLGMREMTDVKELRRQLEAGDFTAVTPLAPGESRAKQWLSFWHHSCPACGQLNTLTVQTATRMKSRNGRIRIALKSVIPKLLLHPGEAEGLVTPPPPPDAAPQDPGPT